MADGGDEPLFRALGAELADSLADAARRATDLLAQLEGRDPGDTSDATPQADAIPASERAPALAAALDDALASGRRLVDALALAAALARLRSTEEDGDGDSDVSSSA